MKKLFFTGILFAFSSATFAQSSSIGIQVGANMASATIKDGSGDTYSQDPKFGFLAGAVLDVPFSSSISFRPELSYIQKGFKVSFSETVMGITFSEKQEATLNFVEAALNFVYNIPAGENQIFVGLGPSFGYGISGEVKSTSTATGQPTTTDKRKVEFGNDEVNDDLKPFDFGGNVVAGFKMNNGIFFKAGYTLGLMNLEHDPNSTFKTKGFSFSIGYMFKKGENFSKDY